MKTGKTFKFLTLALACAFSFHSPAAAVQTAPSLISFQGRLTDNMNNPLAGSYDFAFAIYDAPTGGSLLWSETQNGINVFNGVLTAELGASLPITDSVFSSSYTYLAITVSTNGVVTPLLPRQRLLSVPYAMNAQRINGVDFSALVTTGTAQSISGPKTFTTNINMSGTRITDLAVPISTGDAANKAYVDSVMGSSQSSVLSATQTFTGQNTFLNQVTISSDIYITGRINLLGNFVTTPAGFLDATKLAGLVPNYVLDSSSVTKRGNTFNGPDQLVLLDIFGKLPALDGSALTNISTGQFSAVMLATTTIANNLAAVILSTGTIADSVTAEAVIRSNADTALAGQVNAVILSTGAIADSVTAEAIIRSNADTALAGQVSAVILSTGAIADSVTAEAIIRSNADSALTGRLNAVAVSTGMIDVDLQNYKNIVLTSTSGIATELTDLANVKLSSALATGQIFIGDEIGVATAKPMTGVVAISSEGLTTIGAGNVTNAMLATITAPGKVSDSALSENVAKLNSTQTFTAPQTFSSSVTFQNDNFSVGGSTFTVVSGNVGVGTASPGYKFEVVGGGHFTSSMTVDGGYYGDGSYLTNLNPASITNGILGAGVVAQSLKAGDYLNDVRVSSAMYVDYAALAANATNAVTAANLTGNIFTTQIYAGDLPTNVIAQAIKAGSYLNDVKVSSAMYADNAATAAYAVNAGDAVNATNAVTAANLTGNIFTTQISAGELPTNVIAQSIKAGTFIGDVKVSSAAYADYAALAGNATNAVTAANLTGNIFTTQIYAGDLPTNVIAQAIKAGSYLNDVKVSSAMYADNAATAAYAVNAGDAVNATNAVTAANLTGNIFTTQISAGSLGGSVIASSIAVDAIVDANISAVAAITPSKIAGTAAILGANTFTGKQTMSGGLLVTPAALPGSPSSGDIVIDSGDNNTLKWYDGTVWRENPQRISGNSGAAGPAMTWQVLTGDSATCNTVALCASVMTTTGVGVGTWKFVYTLIYQTANVNTGISFALNHTGTVGKMRAMWRNVTTGGAAATGVGDSVAATNAGQLVEGKSGGTLNAVIGSASAGVDTANTDILAVLEGLIVVTATGDLQLKLGSEVAASAVKIMADSTLELNKIE